MLVHVQYGQDLFYQVGFITLMSNNPLGGDVTVNCRCGCEYYAPVNWEKVL